MDVVERDGSTGLGQRTDSKNKVKSNDSIGDNNEEEGANND